MNNKNQEIYFTNEVIERIIKPFYCDDFKEHVNFIVFDMRPKSFNLHYMLL